MKPRDPKARSIAALQAALDRHGDESARSGERGPEPWPGDLYTLAETAGLPVEWLVVERTRDHCRLVAADTNPALGSTDVPVPADMEGGPLSVRCAVSVQIDLETLRRGERTGTVDPEILESVRRRLEELATGSLDAAPDPELEDWIAEVLEPARAALLLPELKAPGPPPRRFSHRAAMAAILLLLAALGGLSAVTWRFHRGELQARSEIDRLMQERQAVEEEHERQLAALREAQARTQPQRPPEPPPPPPEPLPLQPLVNLAYASFYPGETRGDLREIVVPRQATHLFLLFYVGDRETCASYELEVSRHGSESFTIKGLKPLSGQEVSVAVPRVQSPDGSYQLRLYDICNGERRELGAYEARLKESAR
jgi:hypothetical protein